MGECGESVRGLGIHLNFSVPPNPPNPDDGDKVTTRDAHCGLHNEHLKMRNFKKIIMRNSIFNKFCVNWVNFGCIGLNWIYLVLG